VRMRTIEIVSRDAYGELQTRTVQLRDGSGNLKIISTETRKSNQNQAVQVSTHWRRSEPLPTKAGESSFEAAVNEPDSKLSGCWFNICTTVKKFEGQQVKVNGDLDKSSKTIRVSDIAAAK
jgi:hypothetical protein